MCRPVGTQFGKLMAPLSGSHKGISFSSQIQPSTRACDLASRTAFAYPHLHWEPLLRESTVCPTKPTPRSLAALGDRGRLGRDLKDEWVLLRRWRRDGGEESSRQRKTASLSSQSRRESGMFQELGLDKAPERKGRLR